MDDEFNRTFALFRQLDNEHQQLSEERLEVSRWRGTATQLADTILTYLRKNSPAANIPEWLYRHHPDLYDALEKHSNRLYGDPDRWQQELGDQDI